MHFIVLTPDEVELAALRFEEHENSTERIVRHLRRRDQPVRLAACRGLHRLEQEFGIDLGTICFKFLETETRETPVVQKQVMDYVAGRRGGGSGDRHDLVVSVERAQEIGRLAEGEIEWQSSRDS